jgi:peptidoglycan/xylan/chitin deacetylase (PgdA/CDA1 family)
VSGAGARRVALKVDCDTYEGSKAGLPNLLRLFDKFGIRASFYFTLGPDRSGRAVARVFTRKGFLKKMLRSKAVSMYPVRTMLYGTLLPAPMIGRGLTSVIRSVGDAGHEVGVHGWDHIKWHDRCVSMTEAEVEKEYGAAHAEFERIFGRKARASAAPGWQAGAASLAVQDRYGLQYASNTRLGAPFFPELDGRRFKTLEIPTTVPTWDETYNSPEFADDAAFIAYYVKAVRGTEVHSIHTEVEATALLPLFERQLEAWRAGGITFMTLERIAAETLAAPGRIPGRRIVPITLPGRAGTVTGSAVPF